MEFTKKLCRLKFWNVKMYVSQPSRPLALYNDYLYHMQSIYLHASSQLLVSKCFIQLSIYLPSLTHNLTTAVYFHKLAFLINFNYDDIKMSSIDIKFFNLI